MDRYDSQKSRKNRERNEQDDEIIMDDYYKQKEIGKNRRANKYKDKQKSKHIEFDDGWN